MQILTTSAFPDYELIDSGNGMRLERYGKYTLAKPDPQALWQPHLPVSRWNQADATFIKTHADKGNWQYRTTLPEKWQITYGDVSFWARLTPFKHTGVFPEQSVHWDRIKKMITPSKSIPRILNLFGYTGIASVVAAKAGANVTHVDASKPAMSWARENMLSSGLPADAIRWIIDDALKFTKREIRRGVTYDGIIMDPPVYGHGPNKEPWDFNKHFPQLLTQCREILSPNPLFVIINAYAVSSSAITLGNVLEDMMKEHTGNTQYGELALKDTAVGRLLSTGIYACWERK